MEPAIVQSADQLIIALYGELKKLAHAHVSRLGRGGTLQTTDLVHEAYARMRRNLEHEWQGPRHFFGAPPVPGSGPSWTPHKKEGSFVWKNVIDEVPIANRCMGAPSHNMRNARRRAR
jgi:hypothetical protein